MFIYDGHPGGVGITERGFDAFEGWVADTARMLEGCPCADGCPSCVQSPKCGNLNEMLDKAGGADAAAADGGGIDVRELTPRISSVVDARLPLIATRRAPRRTSSPGTARTPWGTRTSRGRRRSSASRRCRTSTCSRATGGAASAPRLTLAAEQLAAGRGKRSISLSYGIRNDPARLLYEGLGYRRADLPPQRVKGTIVIRGRPVEIDDTLVYLIKDVGVDSRPPRSS